ncbi:MAG: hypothetical protein FWF06_07085, partial [Symbiobacteriaceae bacterium]|nr:hypothetical protein [Symbiobacteriaceae bacterium]
FQEIIKLKTAFPEKRRLTLQEVRQVLAPSADAEVFTLLDLLAEEKLEEAFTLLDDLLRRGETVPRLIASVARQVRQMLQLRALEQRGMRVDAATKALELHPYAAQRLVEKAVAYSNADLITLLRDCCDKDSRLKSGRLGMTSAIDILLLQMYRLRSQSRRRRSG